MGRASNAKKRRRERPALVETLKMQLQFLEHSATAYDRGFEGEALRLATVVRVLVHDTNSSHSLLGQLEIKDKVKWIDTAGPIEPGNLMPDHGLVGISYDGNGGWSYSAGLGIMPVKRETTFTTWWEDPVMRLDDDRKWNRKLMVLELANKEGGAHVDPKLNAEYESIANEEKLGWFNIDNVTDQPTSAMAGNPIAVSVRQLTYELLETLRRDPQYLT